MKAFNRFRNSPAGLVLAILFVLVGMANGARWMYSEYRADMREDMVTAMQPGTATEVDMVAACIAWSKRQGVSDDACQPFADTEFSIMNGGKPIGDDEGLTDWFYYYVPDGTMIVGPGRVRIWIPADRQTCPQLIVGTMTDGMCPTWMDVPK